MRLAPIEVTLLEAAPAGEPEPIAAIAAATDAPAVTLRGAAHRLADKGLCTVSTETTTTLSLTDEGRRYHAVGLPEHRLATAAAALSDPSVPEAAAAAELADDELQIALANAARKQLASIDGGVVTADEPDPDDDPEVAALAAVAAGDAAVVDAAVRDRLLERSLVAADERTELRVALTDAGVTALMEGVEATDAVGQLTPELLQSGRWADVEYAPYNVTADPRHRPTGGSTSCGRPPSG
jgi:Phenylalanyl-tRNA synthetase alpha subunit